MLLFVCPNSAIAQDVSIENADITSNTTSEVNKKRLHWSLTFSSAAYLGSSAVLYNSWYKDYPRSAFHMFDDSGEWRGVDKAGHIFSGYFQSHWSYKGLRWIGLDPETSIIAGSGVGLLAQTTIEVMDGFSSEWGFSATDFTANVIGVGAFASQQLLWNEQRILLKTSSTYIDYKDRYGAQYFEERAAELYGKGFASRYLKDYNAQTTWLSLNVKAFFPDAPIPEWLNIAMGYGAENMFGGYTNDLSDNYKNWDLPRYSQFYLSLDADLSRIDTNSPFLRTLLDVLNILKMPFSTLEINTLGEVKFHLIRF